MRIKSSRLIISLIFTLIAALIAMAPAQAALSKSDAEVYKAALRAADAKKFKDAFRISQDAQDKLLTKYIRWQYLRTPGSGATFEEMTDFIEQNPDWPQMGALRQRVEEIMPASLDDGLVMAWFAKYPPQTLDGKMRYADALIRANHIEPFIPILRHAWIEGYFTAERQKQFYGKYKNYLTMADHIKRIDRLLWEHQTRSVERMIPIVSKDWQALANARIGLYRRYGNVDALVRAVPASLTNHPGLMYERIRWRRLKNSHDGAVELLLNPPENLGRDDKWWRERDYQVRRLIKEKQFHNAYTLASIHGIKDTVPLADAEFLSGWIALVHLNEPATALPHFEKAHEVSSFPISMAKGAYWAGRAAQSLKDTRKARNWFEKAAVHNTTFYGQLAYVETNRNANLKFTQAQNVTREDTASFRNNEVVEVVNHLTALGKLDKIDPLILHLGGDTTSPGQKELAAMLARRVGRFDLGVVIARRALRQQAPLVLEGYPIVEIQRKDGPEKALVNAVIRQESNFKTAAVSRAGARGLMQIMPATARKLASDLKLNYSPNQLVTDPTYNVKLGHHYLEQLLKTYDGSYVLTLAAYNAGPGRVNKWLKELGDPRKDVDVVNWIENIPYSETRGYVMRVLENLAVYRARTQSFPFADDTFMAIKLDLDNPANRYVWNSHIHNAAWSWSEAIRAN